MDLAQRYAIHTHPRKKEQMKRVWDVNINQKCEETSTENVRKHQLFL
jgi:hypothetical protein